MLEYEMYNCSLDRLWASPSSYILEYRKLYSWVTVFLYMLEYVHLFVAYCVYMCKRPCTWNIMSCLTLLLRLLHEHGALVLSQDRHTSKTNRVLLVTCSTRVKKEVIYLCLICCGIVSFLLEQIHFMILIDSLGHIKSSSCLWKDLHLLDCW